MDVAATEHLFTTKRILLRLEAEIALTIDARETLLLLLNETLRFCPNVTIDLPTAAGAFAPALELLAADIHGNSTLVFGRVCSEDTFDAIVNIGTEIGALPNWITVNGDGWLCRVATSTGTDRSLPPGYTTSNHLGALGAACLGAGQAFLALIGEPLLARPIEVSLYTLEQGRPGELVQGPPLPFDLVGIDVLLVGCGGVGNGWVYAIHRAPVTGRVECVDHQALRPENLGAYVCATRGRVTKPKVQIVKEELQPELLVVPRSERFSFFKARIGYRQTYVPAIVLSALDNPHTRRDVQRLWAPLTIDLAAEELTSQVIVKRLDDDGQCLLEAYTAPLGEEPEFEALAAATGLSVERLRDFESEITDRDIAAAPPEMRPALEAARRRGQPICGRVGDLDLEEEEYTNQFAPAVPFVTAFTGIVAAAQTMKAQLEPLASLHFQFNFKTYRSRIMRIHSTTDCECAAVSGTRTVRPDEAASAHPL